MEHMGFVTGRPQSLFVAGFCVPCLVCIQATCSSFIVFVSSIMCKVDFFPRGKLRSTLKLLRVSAIPSLEFDSFEGLVTFYVRVVITEAVFLIGIWVYEDKLSLNKSVSNS